MLLIFYTCASKECYIDCIFGAFVSKQENLSPTKTNRVQYSPALVH